MRVPCQITVITVDFPGETSGIILQRHRWEDAEEASQPMLWLTKVVGAEAGLEGPCPLAGLCTQWAQW